MPTGTEKKTVVPWGCPNPAGKPYNLTDFVNLLRSSDKSFAQGFLDTLKQANNNDPSAVDCINSYLAPSKQELQDLGIGASQTNSLRSCTDSGLLVAVIAQEEASRP